MYDLNQLRLDLVGHPTISLLQFLPPTGKLIYYRVRVYSYGMGVVVPFLDIFSLLDFEKAVKEYALKKLQAKKPLLEWDKKFILDRISALTNS